MITPLINGGPKVGQQQASMDFEKTLGQTSEIGYVSQVRQGIVYVEGLPGIHLNEIVLFEQGGVGRAFACEEDKVEVLVLSEVTVRVGEKVVRTGKELSVKVGQGLLGKVIDPLGRVVYGSDGDFEGEEKGVDIEPLKIFERGLVVDPLETGVAVVDLIVPLGKGQRQLVVGERKTGKTELLLRTILTQAKQGTVCIYCAIGKKAVDVKDAIEFFTKEGIMSEMVVVATTAAQPTGLVFSAPYSAMTIAEYFKDLGKDVLLVYDDLVTHAKYYREISLMARRFPGRSAYPGDIFYVHAKLMERAGKFKKGSITALSNADTTSSDLSGYIQTNLMSMTDGHVFFDRELAALGRKPAVNPFLSVTRVGQQAQTPLVRDLSRQLSAFLVDYEKMRQFLHFGAELSEQAKQTLALGDRILTFLEQEGTRGRRLNVSVFLVGCLWAGFWKQKELVKMRDEMLLINERYEKEEDFKAWLDKLVASQKDFLGLINSLKESGESLVSSIVGNG